MFAFSQHILILIFEARQAFYTPENNNKPCLYLIAKWTQISSFAINIHHKHLYESLTSQATYLKEHLLWCCVSSTHYILAGLCINILIPNTGLPHIMCLDNAIQIID